MGKTSLIISGGKLAEPSAPFSMSVDDFLDEQFGLDRSASPDARGINRALWDAIENHVLASIFFHHVHSPMENTCRIYNADYEIRDCDVTRKFIDDHMSN